MATSRLPKVDSETLNTVLKAYSDVFCNKETPVGMATSVPEAEINTGSAYPIKTPMHHLPLQKRETVEQYAERRNYLPK